MLESLDRPRNPVVAAARVVLVALLVAQVAACATTHSFAPGAMPAVAPVASLPPTGHQPRTMVVDRDGNAVPFRPRTRMVLHLASAARRLHVETQPSELRIGPTGLWLRNTYVPASSVLGFEAEDPHRGSTIALAIVVPIVSIFVGFIVMVAVASGSSSCREGCA